MTYSKDVVGFDRRGPSDLQLRINLQEPAIKLAPCPYSMFRYRIGTESHPSVSVYDRIMEKIRVSSIAEKQLHTNSCTILVQFGPKTSSLPRLP
jgi:hypothetical protein